MRGLDTNVLIRYPTQDDPAQARKVDALIADAGAQRERLHIEPIVLCEIVWVLREGYKHDKSAVVRALEKILEVAQFSLGDRDLVAEAVAAYRSGTGDFADYLIGFRNQKAGCVDTATFDRRLRQSSLFSVL